MPLTSRKKRPLNRKIQHYRDTKLYIIATEGEKTEKQYFDIFRNLKIQVRVIPTEGGLSAPEYVLERLEQFEEQYQIGNEDELWLMIDVDRWGDRKLSQISAATSQKDYQLAVSNPCFEVWLYLHCADYENDDLTCAEVEELLRQHLGSYNKRNLSIDVYKPNVGDAVRRAKRLHTNTNERWPSSLGTHVYKIVEQLI